MNALNSDVSLISCGSNKHGHLTQTVVDRLLATSDVYLTERGNLSSEYDDSVHIVGVIVVRSSDGVSYTVNGETYVAKDHDPVSPLKQRILDQIAVLEAELAALRALAQQMPD